jgi:predicted anti-sigma-YlaC factor YlaD
MTLPTSLWAVAFETAVGILTATYAILSMSGGIVGSVVAVQHWPRLSLFFKQHRISLPLPFHLHRASAPLPKKREE